MTGHGIRTIREVTRRRVLIYKHDFDGRELCGFEKNSNTIVFYTKILMQDLRNCC